ncbi:hypothetical protein [Aestuariivirga sp.]|uniref:hypothetical protein n=1 Tax=Aestuariivirga sp. TaxID=2650926 RepID=UPI003BAA4FA1
MANYRKSQEKDENSEGVNEHLGQAIGSYHNPGPTGEVVKVYCNGISWKADDNLVKVRFAELTKIEVPIGKESEALLLTLNDGQRLVMPVKGRRCRFLDSMEMLRFLNRVVGDLQK